MNLNKIARMLRHTYWNISQRNNVDIGLCDGAGSDEIALKFWHLMKEANYVDANITIEKLDSLGDAQWHSYELPASEIQVRLEEWIVKNWSESQEYIQSVLGICYCFGLSKMTFLKALTVYQGEDRLEFESYLNSSPSESIDPYSSLRKV